MGSITGTQLNRQHGGVGIVTVPVSTPNFKQEHCFECIHQIALTVTSTHLKKLRNPKKVGVGTLTAYSSPAILQLTKHDKPLSGAWNFH